MLYLLNYDIENKFPFPKMFTIFSYFAKKYMDFPVRSHTGSMDQTIDLLPVEEITRKQHSRLQELQPTWALVLN